MTDVTGFGLAGHAAEMAERSDVTLVIEAEALPELPDARRFAREATTTSGADRNITQLGRRIHLPDGFDESLRDLLYDPQTSGGLLIAAPHDNAAMLRDKIAEHDDGCWIIGSVQDGPPLVRVI